MVIPSQIESLTIRSMQLGDVPQVYAIDRLSFALSWSKRAFVHELTHNPNARLWVSEIQRTVVGMLVLWKIIDEAHIATIAVHPEFRQRHIGAYLLIHALQQAVLEGAEMATLEVRAGNLAAQNLYRRLGFEKAGRRKHYYHDNQEDAFIMTLAPLNAESLAVHALQFSQNGRVNTNTGGGEL